MTVALACLAVLLAAAARAREVPALLDVVVVDADGVRLPGVHVRVRPSDDAAATTSVATADTDRMGRARFPSMSWMWPLITARDDAGFSVTSAVALQPGMWAQVQLRLERPARLGRARIAARVAPASVPREPWPIEPTATVEITVLDEIGMPVPFVDVSLAEPGHEIALAGLTGDEGKFTFRAVPKGTYIARARTGDMDSDEAAIRVASGRAHDLTLVLRPTPSTVGLALPPGGIFCGVNPREVATLPEGGAGAALTAAPPQSAPDFRPADRVTAEAITSRLSARVGSALYGAACRSILAGWLPRPGMVLAEEFINAFDYGDRPASSRDAIVTSAEVSGCPWAPDRRLVRIEVRASDVGRSGEARRDLVFLVDASASMEESGWMPLVRQALRGLVDRQRAGDSLGIVTYGGAADTALAPVRATDQSAILQAIAELSAGGSPTESFGIKTAYALAQPHHRGHAARVVLITDGDVNVGAPSRSEMLRLVAAEREKGVMLTVIGLGAARAQEGRLTELAEAGGGTFTVAGSAGDIVTAVLADLEGVQAVVAREVEIDVTMNPLLVERHRPVAAAAGSWTGSSARLRAGQSLVALFEIVPPSVTKPSARGAVVSRNEEGPDGHATPRGAELMTVRLRWKEDGRTRMLETPVIDGGAAFAQASEDFRWTAAAAGFASMLQAGEERSGLSWDRLDAIASGALGADEDDSRAVMLTVLRQATRLSRLPSALPPRPR